MTVTTLIPGFISIVLLLGLMLVWNNIHILSPIKFSFNKLS
jgi:hypothetical protein